MRTLHWTCLFSTALILSVAAGCADVESSDDVLSARSPAEESEPKTDPPPCSSPDPDPGACTSGVLGDGTTCEDPAALKIQASDACAALGLTLVDLAYAPDCGALTRYAKYLCCESAPPPPPDPDPNACTYDVVGDGVTCQDPAALAATAAALCAGLGLELAELYEALDCGAQSTIAKYACCPAP
jgi:hypothetical protein